MIIFLFIFFVYPSSMGLKQNEKLFVLNNGNVFYVGGNGLNNYTNIQDAINDSVEGDTVYVYNESSPYFESIVINKSIYLIGEDKYSTTIDVQGIEADAVTVKADNVRLWGFTIQNAEGESCSYSGVLILSNRSNLANNIIQYNNWAGVSILFGEYNVIQDNIIINNTWDGICIIGKNNKITKNYLSDNLYGITVDGAYHNNISLNTVYKNKIGIYLVDSNRNNTFYQNDITNNEIGIEIDLSSKNFIIKNNFISNEKNAIFRRCAWYELILGFFFLIVNKNAFLLTNYQHIGSNVWEGNYWNRSYVLPYPILGRRGIFNTFITVDEWFLPNQINFDWHPAKEPYDI